MLEVASFAVGLADAEIAKVPRYKLKKAKILFKAGDYPDKDIKVTPEELLDAVKSFSGPIKLASEHKGSIFDEKLGSLVKVEANPDNASFAGYFAVPDWLESIVPEKDQQVSVDIHKKTKKIVGCSWTNNPRIPEAKLTASFSSDQNANGDLPDISDKPSPLDDSDDDDDEGESLEGKDLMNKICAMCKAAKANADPKIHSQEYIDTLDDICEAAEALTGEGDGGGDGKKTDDKDKAGYSKNTPEPKKGEQVETAQFNADSAKTQGELIFKALMIDRRQLPNQKEQFMKSFLKFAEADHVASFSKDAKPENVKTFIEMLQSGQQHTLTTEQMAELEKGGTIEQASFSKNKQGDKPKPMTSERKNELLGVTDVGRQVIAIANGQAKK